MADPKAFHCQLITPDAALLDEQVTSVVMTAHDGEIGVLKSRAPLFCKLGIGQVRIQSDSGMRRFFIDGGFAQVIDNDVTLLTQHAQAVEKIDLEQARAELTELQARKTADAEQRDALNREIDRARTKISLAESR